MASKAKAVQENNSESLAFSAEISKVLQLMIHSLYTNKDIFLRELVSNASDACDKLRYEALQNDALLGDDGELGIWLSFDEEARTVTIADNGIGMNREDLIANLGTIAKSGTQEFLGQLTGDKQKDVSLIGQFGVGFYASFMVADKVEVISRKAGEDAAWTWTSDGLGSFTVEAANQPARRGTAITLHLKQDAGEYLDAFKLKFIVQTYSDHISFPIRLYYAEDDSEEINKGSAIWTRAKSDITEEQYQEFYRHVAHQPDTPWMTLHNKAEGAVEYTNLLFVPSMKPFDLFHPERRRRVKLYVKRVFITDEGIELIPRYLRFLRGVVDSQDLPLNISRETLQHNPLLDKIRDAVTKKVLAELIKRSEKDADGYLKFWENFGAVLKEGLCESHAPKEKILEACRFHSTHDDGALVSLEDYIGRMKDNQEAIYFINGDDVKVLLDSPQLEGFRKRGIEVLLLADHVDDFWVNATPFYKEKPFKSVIRCGEDLKSFAAPQEDQTTSAESATTDDDAIAALIERMQQVYGSQIRQVRTTAKLSESPVCLAVGEGDMDLRMERFLLEHKQLPKGAARILEINPDHKIIKGLARKVKEESQSEEIDQMVLLLLDQAKIQEGEPIKDPSAFSRRLSLLLASSLV